MCVYHARMFGNPAHELQSINRFVDLSVTAKITGYAYETIG